ncbi:MAG: 4Fe-4S dicluster domain-containing protein, partial [Gammaproteobacteria bacterium]|nr:4Fe-4S dicluster domain-containing protein [Gammaproteobacteria bacterium]
LLHPHRESIAKGFPDLHRSLTGYNLRDALLPDGGIDLTRLVAGAEGTLGIVSRIRLRLKPLPSQKAVVVVRYADFDQALRDAQWLVESAPAAVETLDDRIQTVARQDPLWPLVEPAMQGDGEDGRVMCNFVELVADSVDSLELQLAALIRRLEERGSPYHVARTRDEMAALWNIRSRSVGMLGRTKGVQKPIAFVEDTAVPPAALADYIAEFRALLEGHGVDYAMFGHVDVGCLHVRPALDMTDPADRARVRIISDAVVSLVKRYRGLLWGEHGKGFRGEYTRDFFGDALYQVLADVKALFDPNNRMNPGKIVAPSTRPEPLFAIDAVPFRGQFDQQIAPATRQRWDSAMACNGNGVCFDWDSANVLCPSYKVTGDRVQSPKGRASLLREWLRQLAEKGQTPEQIKPRFIRRARKKDSTDFSHQVHQAMAGCLGCKACATQCPVHVNIPDVRSRFLEVYHRTYRRDLRDYLVANAETLAPLLVAFSPLLAPIMKARFTQRLLSRIGLVDAPLPRRDNGIREAKRAGFRVARTWAQAKRYLAAVDNPVPVLPDAFTAFHENATLPAVCALIAATGGTPVVLPFQASGKALHAHGMLPAQRRVSQRLLQQLLEIDTGTGIVIIEPSVGLFLRDDCQGLLSDRHPCLSLFSEWLHEHRDALGRFKQMQLEDSHSKPSLNYALFVHCTEQTADATAANAWKEIFEVTGQSLSLQSAGCCGMAGAYGHQREHLAYSKALYESGWSAAVEADAETKGKTLVLATGYSCRTQVKRFSANDAVHPAVALANCLGG